MKAQAWVIGGSSGIGQRTAVVLQSAGLAVAVTAEHDADVRSEAALAKAYDDMDCPMYVVYSAGINTLMWNDQMDLDVVRDLFDVNVFGFMRLIKVIANSQAKFASVVAVSSDAARRPMRTSMAYCASKAALDMCVRQAAREHANRIRVNAVAPGMTAPTGMSAYIDQAVPNIRGWSPEQARAYEASQNPRGDIRITPAEVAQAIKYLLLDAPDAQTGSIMEVNCGR